MTPKEVSRQELPTVGLLHKASLVYKNFVKQSLVKSGYKDLPHNGSIVLCYIAYTDRRLSDLIEHLAISKQATGQLIDTLVTKGYLERNMDSNDRRRLTVTLTKKGRDAARAARSAAANVDATLAKTLGAGELTNMRAALSVLIETNREAGKDD